jgi:hypothetical protein
MSHLSPPRNRPVVVRPDNFTPPERTPWGGRRIPERYKDGLVEVDAPVGESWEISVEPDFPARIDGAASDQPGLEGRLLDAHFHEDPVGWLGDDSDLGCALLVKLLDAATPLSVQIHPGDDDPSLGPGQSGKPESWWILDADPGAGLFLGLEDGVDERSMRRAVESGEDVSALLHFVEVAPGDFFLIEAGTPHAIGAGVTLVEPQRVRPGRRGVTYRYWDWNRTYDDQGRPDPQGRPRALHLEEALACTRWDLPRGEALLERVRLRAPSATDSPRLRPLCGPEGPLPSTALSVASVEGTGPLILPPSPRLRGLTVTSGALRIDGLRVERGRSVAIAAQRTYALELDGVRGLVASALP